MIWKTPISVEELQKRCAHTMVAHLKIDFTHVGPDSLQAEMAVGPHLMQPMGIMHGGASCAFAETVASAAANYCIDQKIHVAVGLDINTNHIRTVKEGTLTATAKPFHLGKTTQVWSVEIRDEKNQLISISRVTMIAIEK